jgi:hypothetical protein
VISLLLAAAGMGGSGHARPALLPRLRWRHCSRPEGVDREYWKPKRASRDCAAGRLKEIKRDQVVVVASHPGEASAPGFSRIRSTAAQAFRLLLSALVLVE